MWTLGKQRHLRPMADGSDIKCHIFGVKKLNCVIEAENACDSCSSKDVNKWFPNERQFDTQEKG